MNSRKKQQRAGFSLLELLAAMVVMAMLLVLFGSLVGQVTTTWQSGKESADNYAKARLTLDLLERDLRSALLAKGLPGMLDSTGEPALTFYSSQPGPTSGGALSDRPLSLISYRTEDHPASPLECGLQRGSVGISTSDPTPFSGLTAPFPAATPVLPDSSYQLICPGVLRMDYRFISADGTTVSKSFATGPGEAARSRHFSVCLLICDEATLRRMDEAGSGFALLVQQFDSNSDTPDAQLPAGNWRTAAAQESTFSGLAGDVSKALRIYERTFRLPVYQ